MAIVVVRTVQTPAPVDAVAGFLSDFTTTAEWDPHTVSCVSVDGGPVAVGKRYENTQKLGPRTTTFCYTVVAYTPGERIRLESRSSPVVAATDEMTFAAAGDGTIVTYRATFTLHGPLRYLERLFAPLLNRLGDDGERGMRERLAAL